ncbi:MAG: Cys-tRNA(Pro) deacylase [Kineosporiaceae bacterium]|nr:Cys-tRNA(Pro) deacylase [Aeromicrobium sp.]
MDPVAPKKAKPPGDSADSTPATAQLHREGIPFAAHTYLHDPRAKSFGREAAELLGLEPARVFKTLMAEMDGTLVVGIVPVTGKLDLKALAAALGGKRAQMADPLLAQRATGYVLGGISPIGQKRSHRTVLDSSAAQWPSIYVSGGRRGLDLELTPDDLVAVTGALRAGIAR